MNKFFNLENPFWNAMGRLFDLFTLNVLWLLCSIPVFTIGASTTAFYYALINLSLGEEHYISKDFFHSFKQNFKQGTLLGIGLTLAGVFLAWDISLCRAAGTGIYTFFMVFFAVFFLMWLFLVLYAFPLLAKFDKRTRDLLPWAFTLSLRHIFKTLIMVFTLAAALWICHLLPGMIFIAVGLVGDVQIALLLPIIKPMVDANKVEQRDDNFISEETDEIPGEEDMPKEDIPEV